MTILVQILCPKALSKSPILRSFFFNYSPYRETSINFKSNDRNENLKKRKI